MDETINNRIISIIETKLKRKLNQFECEAFSQTRSFLAYEMIFDMISSENISKEELEIYVKSVTEELKK